jgi:coenzyme PQQ biosynthesis protein PqqD
MTIADNNKPALAVGCRWGGSQEEPVLLYPEGAIKVKGSGLAILLLCDGQRTFSEILAELQCQYVGADAEKIRDEARGFLEQLHGKRIVNL